jgi:hypothetical protein
MDPFNDFDGSVPDMMATYPDPVTGNPIPTIQWEAFRQGFYDMCYLQTLKNRISESKGQTRENCQKAWDKIMSMVGKYSDADGDLGPLRTMPYNELEQIRQIAADALSSEEVIKK